MKLGLMSLAALTLGVSALAPVAARADYRDDDRGVERREIRIGRDYWRDRDDGRERDRDRDSRHDHRHDYDVTVGLREVPPVVINTALHHGNGRHVESARRVRRDGETFYILHMDGARKVHINVRVATDGCLIAIERLPRR